MYMRNIRKSFTENFEMMFGIGCFIFSSLHTPLQYHGIDELNLKRKTLFQEVFFFFFVDSFGQESNDARYQQIMLEKETKIVSNIITHRQSICINFKNCIK